MAYKDNCTTLKKVGADEPIFVLRAQDWTAPFVILEWVKMNPQISHERRHEALVCAEAMLKWSKRKEAD